MPKKKYPKITKKDLEEGVKKWKEENELDGILGRCIYAVEMYVRSASKGNLNETELREAMNKIKKEFKKELSQLPKENEEYRDCPNCNAMILQLFSNPLEKNEAREVFLKDPSKLQCDLCNNKRKIKVPKYWEEEFEDVWGNWVETGYDLNHYDVMNLLIQHLGRKDCEVKIKARKGEIVIKRVEE